MRILVTGAAGFIGSHLAERLAALDHAVVGLDCLTDFYPRAQNEANTDLLHRRGVDVLPLDLSTDDLGPVLRDVEVVYHLAAQPGLLAQATFESYVRHNITATQRLLEVAQRAPSLRGFINISTSSVYGTDATGSEDSPTRPVSYYGITKLAAEQLALAAYRASGFPACSFRLFSVYGPRERPDKLYPRLIGALLADRPFPLHEGSERHLRSYTFVGDIVEGLVRALAQLDRCQGEVFNLGTDRAITTGDGIRIVETIVGRTARIDRQPPRRGDQERTHASISKAREQLGYHPSVTPEEGLAQTVAWYREQGRQRVPSIGEPQT
jgi:nucleoside-diphosphate-sugar epimerase